jgi:hypothetical protein
MHRVLSEARFVVATSVFVGRVQKALGLPVHGGFKVLGVPTTGAS